VTRDQSEIRRVLALKDGGATDREASAATGVPISTIRGWRNRGVPAVLDRSRCPGCNASRHDWGALDPHVYMYLLGLYLGDGHIRSWGRGWVLRISLDAAYPGIIDECASAVTQLVGRAPKFRGHHSSENCVNVDSGWQSWPCLLPQHGVGRKHTRTIALTDWQNELMQRAPGALLRGLIHSDGWRGLNRVQVKGHDYAYARYQFSNRSEEIRRIFTSACDLLGVEWRPWTRHHISVAKRRSVAILDQYVGPKA
jgi:hypothetical protein